MEILVLILCILAVFVVFKIFKLIGKIIGTAVILGIGIALFNYLMH